MKKHNWINLALDIIGIVVLYLVFNYTSPTDSGSLGVFLIFVLIYLVIFGIITFVWGLYQQLALNKIIKQKDYEMAAVLAFLPAILLILRSSGALNIMSTIATVAVVILLMVLVPKLR